MLLEKKNRKKTEENKKDRKTGEMIISKKNKECSTSSHLRQGFYTLFWSLEFKLMMHIEIYNVCQITIFFSSKKPHEFSNTSKIQNSDSKKTCRDLVLSDLICYTCYLCCLKKKWKKKRRKTKKTE